MKAGERHSGPTHDFICMLLSGRSFCWTKIRPNQKGKVARSGRRARGRYFVRSTLGTGWDVCVARRGRESTDVTSRGWRGPRIALQPPLLTKYGECPDQEQLNQEMSSCVCVCVCVWIQPWLLWKLPHPFTFPLSYSDSQHSDQAKNIFIRISPKEHALLLASTTSSSASHMQAQQPVFMVCSYSPLKCNSEKQFACLVPSLIRVWTVSQLICFAALCS